MAKGTVWSSEISSAILQFHQNGIMQQLEEKWIEFGNCPKDDESTTLGIKHLLGKRWE